jgi:hypothetical protein
VAPLDAYCRGSDLIATYGPSDLFPFRYQAYWRHQRAIYPGALAAVELVVSIQTQLLDTQPRLTVSSLLPASACWRIPSVQPAPQVGQKIAGPPAAAQLFTPAGGIGCFRFQLAPGMPDYVEMVHPVDFQATTLDAHGPAGNGPAGTAPLGTGLAVTGPATRLCHQLFGGRLEKGVILRSRVLGLFLPRAAASGMIAEAYRTLAAEALPLTT